MRKALITGVTGQDGSSSFNTGRVDEIYTDLHEHGGRCFLHVSEMLAASSVSRLLDEGRPDVCHLGGTKPRAGEL